VAKAKVDDNPRVTRSGLILISAVALATAAACGYGDGDDDDRLVGPRGDTETVRFEDLVVEIPEDWDSHTNADESALWLANLELDADTSEGGIPAPEDFQSDDVFISIGLRLPCEPQGLPQNLPVVVQALDLEPAARGHSTACYAFFVEGEFLEDEPTYELFVNFGSESPPPALIDEVNDVLATLRVD
jgi:hypothetical protein